MAPKDKSTNLSQKAAAEISQPIEQLYERGCRSKRRRRAFRRAGARRRAAHNSISLLDDDEVASPSIGLSLPANERPERVNNVSAFHAGLAPGWPATRLDNLPLRLSSRKSRSHADRRGRKRAGPRGWDRTTEEQSATERNSVDKGRV